MVGFVQSRAERHRGSRCLSPGTPERRPIPTRDAAPAAFNEIAALARILSRRTDPDALARLNAIVAQLYQLSDAEFEHILSTFPLIPIDDRQRAMDAFRRDTR